MNVLSIDYGDARVGIAYGDTDHKIAFPLKVIHNTTSSELIHQIQTIVQERSIHHILIGYPLNLRSESTIQTQKVLTFAELLRSNLKCSIELCDERFTTELAKQYLQKNQSLDIESARIILEEWLENQ